MMAHRSHRARAARNFMRSSTATSPQPSCCDGLLAVGGGCGASGGGAPEAAEVRGHICPGTAAGRRVRDGYGCSRRYRRRWEPPQYFFDVGSAAAAPSMRFTLRDYLRRRQSGSVWSALQRRCPRRWRRPVPVPMEPAQEWPGPVAVRETELQDVQRARTTLAR